MLLLLELTLDKLLELTDTLDRLLLDELKRLEEETDDNELLDGLLKLLIELTLDSLLLDLEDLLLILDLLLTDDTDLLDFDDFEDLLDLLETERLLLLTEMPELLTLTVLRLDKEMHEQSNGLSGGSGCVAGSRPLLKHRKIEPTPPQEQVYPYVNLA